MAAEDWADGNMKCFGMLMDGRAQVTGIRKRGHETTMLLVVNGHHDLVVFTLPECAGGKAWELLIDTNLPDDDSRRAMPFGGAYEVTGRSLLLFLLQPETT
jgi:glycogen operon protein